VRPAAFPRRVLYLATLIAAGSLADPALAQDISINFGQGNGGVTERAIQLIALLTVLSIAPSILIMMTSFTRIVVCCRCCVPRSAPRPRRRIPSSSHWPYF